MGPILGGFLVQMFGFPFASAVFAFFFVVMIFENVLEIWGCFEGPSNEKEDSESDEDMEMN